MNRLALVIAVLAGFVLLGAKTALADTINVPTTFAALASSDGDNTLYTVTPNLTITTGGGITCNGPASPSGASACNITFAAF